jgi:hypothetical protein
LATSWKDESGFAAQAVYLASFQMRGSSQDEVESARNSLKTVKVNANVVI